MVRFLLLLSLLCLVTNAATAQAPKQRPVTGPTPSTPPLSLPDKTAATRSSWSFLSLGATHADTFEREHPTYDGRGVIILIFDTGVDPGVPGLSTTTEGKAKVIEVRDYSGTGDVPYKEATRSGDELKVDNAIVLKGLNSLKSNPVDGKYFYGALPEKRFQNGLSDLNFNASESDNFGVLIFKDATDHYVAYVDSDGDQDLSDEHELTNYHEHFDTFSFHSTDTSGSSAKRLTGAINIYPERSLASVYFDDGSHGTHVAGIAAGHDIDSQKGFNGVAPGAEIVAVKFADNSAGGVTVSGSMQRAFLYASELAKSQPKPVVVNMSFGIGNELEGQSAMDKWLDSLLTATPNLTVCVSAGNDGPGLSSIGLPSSSDRIVSSGAALPDDAARDLYNQYLTHPVLFDFSSRGGELAKPDLVSPGTAVSTVPDYVGGDRYNGTSMSSPYTAGCAAVLLSAMKQAFPDWKTNAFAIKRAMMLSAAHIDGTTPLDEGYGMIDVPAAFDLLSKWQRKNYIPIPVHVSAAIPSPVKTGTAAYFRAGNYPTDGERETFSILPEARPGTTDHQKALGMEAFDLVSDEPWMAPLESSVYRRGEGSISVDVRYNAKLLQKPGLYSGRIWGYDKGREHTRSEARFELLNTIIIPHTFSDQNSNRVTLSNIKLQPGAVQREFFAIPPGTKAVKLTLTGREGKGGCSISLNDNDGREFSGLSLRRNSTQRTTTTYLSGGNLSLGVWEADISRTSASEDEADLAVDFTVEAVPLDIRLTDGGMTTAQEPRARLSITNPTLRAFSAQTECSITGYQRTFDTVINSSDLFTQHFTPRPGEKSVLFEITLPAEDYNLFTDITCMVQKPDSGAVYNQAFDYRKKNVAINFGDLPETEDSTESAKADPKNSYLLYVRGGLALIDRKNRWHVHVKETRYLSSSSYLSAEPSRISIQPYQTQDLDLSSGNAMVAPPTGYKYIGILELKRSDQETVKFPISF